MLRQVKLVPGDGPTTHGTKIILSDGSELGGILKVVLKGEPNDIWRAEITVLCLPPELEGVEATVDIPQPDRLDLLEAKLDLLLEQTKPKRWYGGPL